MEHTLVLRLSEDDDPTVGDILQRCHAAAEAFHGRLVGWETGDALQRAAKLKERLEELHAQLAAHGLLDEAEGAGEAPGKQPGGGQIASPAAGGGAVPAELPAAAATAAADAAGQDRPRVAGEVAHAVGMPVWPLPEAPGGPGYPFPLSAGLAAAPLLQGLRDDVDALVEALASLAGALAAGGMTVPAPVQQALARLRPGSGRRGEGAPRPRR